MIQVKDVLPDVPIHIRTLLQSRIEYLVDHNTEEFEACMIVCDYYGGERSQILKNHFISYYAWKKVKS